MKGKRKQNPSPRPKHTPLQSRVFSSALGKTAKWDPSHLTASRVPPILGTPPVFQKNCDVSLHAHGPTYPRRTRMMVVTVKTVPGRQDGSFRKCTGKEGLPSQVEWDIYFNGYVGASKTFQNYQIPSLKDSLQKANKKN